MKVLLLVITLFYCSTSLAQVVLVMHKHASIEELDRRAVKALYLGKQRFIKGQRIIPLDQAKQSPSRTKFYDTLFDMSQSQIVSHWSRLIFTGKGQSPMALEQDQSVLEFVASNPNMLGYIHKDFVSDQVKIVFEVKEESLMEQFGPARSF